MNRSIQIENKVEKRCSKSPNGVHAIKYGPDSIIMVHRGEITIEEYKSGQFCIYCGKAIW